MQARIGAAGNEQRFVRVIGQPNSNPFRRFVKVEQIPVRESVNSTLKAAGRLGRSARVTRSPAMALDADRVPLISEDRELVKIK